ncbi:MAG: helix-turn-helix transcriptional regulator [Clostridia bacterium]|nr:helix-turn-helix transcriptional regulator [Clostridia bacterium]
MAEFNAPSSGGQSRFPDGFRILQGKQEYVTYLDHSSIRIWPSDVAAHYDPHRHSAVEIIMPSRGVSLYHVQDDVYRVQPGEILIVPSDCQHALTEPPETQRYLLLFEPTPITGMRDMAELSPMMQRPIYLHDGSETHSQAKELLNRAVECYFAREPLWNTQCYSYLMQLYALLGRRYLRSSTQPREMLRRNIDPAIMNSVLTYINEHYMDDISLENAALFAGFSKYYFSRMFKQFSGLPFSEYLTRKRLNVASDLLVRTNQPIREIAVSSGFGSTATFNRTFREHKNCTPSQFRAIYGMVISPAADKPLF